MKKTGDTNPLQVFSRLLQKLVVYRPDPNFDYKRGISYVTVDLPDDVALSKDNRPVKSIAFIVNTVIIPGEPEKFEVLPADKEKFPKAIVKLDLDGQIVYYQTPSYSFFASCKNLPIAWITEDGTSHAAFAVNAIFEGGFTVPHMRADRALWALPLSYNRGTNGEYAFLRVKIADTLSRYLLHKTNLQERAQKNGVYIISLGCGKGDDIKAASLFISRHFNCSGLGIDDNASNIEAARNLQVKGIDFEKLNATHIGKEVSERLASFSNEKKPVVVVIMVGFLTRQTVEGSREAVSILQQMKYVDVIAATGVTASIINLEVANKIGFSFQVGMSEMPKNIKYESKFSPCLYLLSPQSLVEQVEHTIRASLDYSAELTFLDLSFSAQPVAILRALRESNNHIAQRFQQVDLSNTYILPEEVDDFVRELLLFSKLNRVILDPYMENISLILSRLKAQDRWAIYERCDFNSEYGQWELSPLSPAMCKKLGFYETLPQKLVFTPSSQQSPKVPALPKDKPS